jgi:hypothetical protein
MSLAADLFIAGYLVVILAGHRRAPALVRPLLRPLNRVVDGLGLRQYWAMFAPDPARLSLSLEARIDLATGAAIRWVPPARQGFRRRLFLLMLATVGGTAARRSMAEYLARTYTPGGDRAVGVSFIRHERPVEAPWYGTAGGPNTRQVERIDLTAARERDAV